MRALAYKVEGRRVGDTNTVVPHAVAACATCATEHAITMPRNAHNPEAIGERFRRKGFEFDPFKRAGIRCPGCIERARRAKAAFAGGTVSSVEVIPMSHPPSRPPSHPPTTTPHLADARPPGGASPPAAVTLEQRAKVRELLTGTFDEKRGHYLDAYSDQRVATECGVALQVVREMREMWLGPVRSVPELEGLQAEIAALAERAGKHVAYGIEIERAAQTLKQRLAETRRQLGLAE